MTNTRKLDLGLQNIPSDIWKEIAAIDELKGRWTAGANLHPQILSRLKRSVGLDRGDANLWILVIKHSALLFCVWQRARPSNHWPAFERSNGPGFRDRIAAWLRSILDLITLSVSLASYR